jgi:23S rRNA (uracil1939-C5)-methyltransferase
MQATPTDGPLQVGEQYTVTVETLASGGDGVARASGFTVFIPYAAPGDVVEVEVVRVAKHYARARIVRLITPGPDRVPTPCPLATGCPGCQLQHLRYEAQLQAKAMFVRDNLQHIGRLSHVEVLPTIGMAEPWRYRNKGEFIAQRQDDGIRLGYHGEDGTIFTALEDCPLQHPLSLEILHAVEELATQYDLPLAQLITRISPSEGAALAILVCWEWHERLPEVARVLRERLPALAGVLWSRVRGRSVVRRTLAELLDGVSALTQHLGKWQYHVSAESFFQVNSEQAERLVELAVRFAGNLREAIFADAYCGVGTFLIPCAVQALRAFGIEEHPVALKDAARNLAHYAIHDVKLYEARVEVMVTRLLRKGRHADVVVLDPPRKGAGRVVLEGLRGLGVERVVLVSCDPATFARDAGDLAALGYRLETVQPVDMFPQTWHVETIALAVREE